MKFDRKLVALVLAISMMLGTVPVSAAELNAQYGEASYYDIAVLNYSRMIAMQNGVVPAQKEENGMYYLINLAGQTKSNGYLSIEALGGNYFAVTDSNWYVGVIDSNGYEIVAPASNVFVDHRNGIICVSQNSSVNYYNAADWSDATSDDFWGNSTGETTSPDNELSDGTNTVIVTQSALYNENNELLDNPNEYEAFYTNRPAFLNYGSSYSSGKIIYVKKNDQCGVIDLSGKVIVPLGTYDYIGELNPKGYIAVYSGNNSQVYSKDGNGVATKSFVGKQVATEVYYRDLVFTTGDGNYGVMDINEATLIPAEYKMIEGAKFEGYYYVVKGSTYPDRTVGLYDDNCNVVVTDTHKSITQLGNNFIVYDGNSYGMKDGAGAEILATSYEDINAYSTEFIELYDGAFWRVVNSAGQEILPNSMYGYNVFDKSCIEYSLDPRSAYLYDGYEDGVYPIVEATSADLTYFPHIFNGSTEVDTLTGIASNINSDGLFVYKDASTGKYGFGSTTNNLPTPISVDDVPLYGGGDSLVGTYTEAILHGKILSVDASAGTVNVGGAILAYSDSFNDVKLSAVVVGENVEIYLDAVGKIVGYHINVSGQFTAYHSGEGSVTVGGTKYYYHSSVTAGERIPSSALGRRCDLYLDGDGKIRSWHVEGTVDTTVAGYVTEFSDAMVKLRRDWDSADTTTYQYADTFSGVKFSAEDVNRWFYGVDLDSEGKIKDYRFNEDGIVVSVSNSGVTYLAEDGNGNKTYDYITGFSGDKLTAGSVGKRVNLGLNSSRKIMYCGLHDYGKIISANPSTGTVTIRHSRASGNVDTAYTYVSSFNGAKINAEYVGQWVNIEMDDSGKIAWYWIDVDDESSYLDTVEILSVTPTIIGRGETVNLEVTVSYNLTTVNTGIVYLGVNLNEPNRFHLEDNETVTTGSGTVTLNATVTTATGWDTAIYANLSDANHGEEWSPLATDRWDVGANLIASGTCGASANWTLNSAGTLTISGTGAMADYDNSHMDDQAPWRTHASDIKRVVIQSGITRIGSFAFDGCALLTEVSIPNTVTTIGNNSFENCSSLTSISFPNSLETIEHSVFYGSGLTSVTVPDSVTVIGGSAFSGCDNLTSATLGNGIRKIDQYLFAEDSKLTSLTIPRNVTEIAANAFSGTGIEKFYVASGNTAFSAEDGVLYNAAKTLIVCYPPQGNVNYIIPKTVGTVDLSLFWKTSIETIRISSGTTVTNTETIPDGFGSAASDSLKLYFQGDVTNTSGWEFLNKTGEKISVTAEQWEYHEDEIALSDAVLYVPYYANTVSTIGDSSLKFYGTGLVDTGLEVDITGGFVTGAPLATGKTVFTVSSGAKTYTFSVTTRANDATTVTAETSAELVIEQTVSNMTTANVTDQVFQIEDKDETTEVKSNFEKFLDVYLDGVKLVGGKIEPDSTEQDAIKSVDDVPDDWEYYAEEGSTKITVRAQTFQNKTAGTHTIAATFEKTVVNPDTQAVTREVITAAQNFAITTSDGGGNGGGGGGGGGSPAAAQQPAAETKTPELSYSVTNGVAALDSTSVTQMAASATEQKSDTLTLDLTNGGETVTAVSLPAGLMDQIAQLAASGENSVDSLAIVLSSGSLELDAETLSEIAQQAGGESISMALEEVSADQLSDGQQAALAELSAEKIISIEISCADKQITDFGGGRVNLSIPFTAAADKNARGYAVWHLADDGKTSRHSTGYADGKISFRTAHFSNYAVAYREPNLFTDVLDGLWYTNDVDHVAALGIMNGVSGTKFAPNTALTRAMFAQIIYNAENGTAGAPSSFSDVPDGMWYTDAVNWAAQNRIVSGIGNSQYAPDREITREELVMMLYNYATYKGYDAKTDVELTRFSDSSSVSTWAETAMKWAVRNKLINGVGEKLLAGDKATRAQVAKVMAYFLEQYAR